MWGFVMGGYNLRKDNTPPFQEPENPVGTKGKKSRKRFAIEGRYVGESTLPFYRQFREWHLFRKYNSARARDEALRTLSSSGQADGYHSKYEYRAADL